MVYLDYSATTPVAKEVIDSFTKVATTYIGNPNSLHKLGTEANELIKASTNQIADLLNIKSTEIIYTSGATESSNLAIQGICLKYKNRGNHIITTELEHSSVIETIEYLTTLGFTYSFVKLDQFGQVDLNDLKNLITDKTILVTIASVNSETGIKQPISEIGKILKEYKKLFFHSDITQSIGKEKISLENIDLASLSSQKFYGLKGIGALIKKESIILEPIIHGGKSTTIYRSGTPATPLIVSMAKALRLSLENLDTKNLQVKEINKYLIEKLTNLNILINSNNHCIPHIINISIPGIKPETMLHALELDNIYISTKTACSTSNISSVVYKLTNDENRANSSLRISISYLTTKEEIDIFIKSLESNIKKLKEL